MSVPTYLMRNHVEQRVIALGGAGVRRWQREDIAARLAELVQPAELGRYAAAANDNLAAGRPVA